MQKGVKQTMIDFKCYKGGFERASFGGSIEELATDLTFEIALIYGGFLNGEHGEELAEVFKHVVITGLNNPFIQDFMFSDKLYKGIMEDGGAMISSSLTSEMADKIFGGDCDAGE